MTNFSEKLQRKIERQADEFEERVYLADPEMVDSNPSKLYGYGAALLSELLVECYFQIKNLNESLEGHVGQEYADSIIGKSTHSLIDQLEAFVKED